MFKKTLIQRWKLIPILLLLTVIIVSSAYAAAQVTLKPNSLHYVRVSRVIDGDTIDVTFKKGAPPERVRLIGVNTPETEYSPSGAEYYGKEASDFTKASLAKRNIWLQFDIGVRDKYQRLLAYVWMEKPQDMDDQEEIRDKMFNAWLLLEGYAQTMTIQPNSRYANLFVRFQREAKTNNRGLWNKL